MEELLTKILEAIVILSLPFIFKVKIQPPNEFYEKRLEDLKSTFRKIDVQLGAFMFIIWIPCSTLFLGAIFWLLFSVTEPTFPANTIFFSSNYDSDSRLILSISLGLIISFATILQAGLYFLRNKLAQDFGLYLQYFARESNINFISFTNAWATFWCIIALLFLHQVDTCRLKIDDKSIELRRFFSINSETYHFDDVQSLFFSSLVKAPNGSIVKQERYRVLFKNGKQWIIDDWLSGNVSKDSLASYISKKTSLHILHQRVSDW